MFNPPSSLWPSICFRGDSIHYLQHAHKLGRILFPQIGVPRGIVYLDHPLHQLQLRGGDERADRDFCFLLRVEACGVVGPFDYLPFLQRHARLHANPVFAGIICGGWLLAEASVPIAEPRKDRGSKILAPADDSLRAVLADGIIQRILAGKLRSYFINAIPFHFIFLHSSSRALTRAAIIVPA